MKNLLFWGGLGLAAFVGYHVWRTGAVDAVVGAGTAPEADAYARYLASDAYRTSPPQARLTQTQFIRAWRTMPAGARPHILRSFTMTQPQVVSETISDPAFRDALAAASMAWRRGFAVQ